MGVESLERRHVLALIGAALIGGLGGAHAQQSTRMRRVGMIINLSEVDPEAAARVAAFKQVLEKLGWIEGKNLRIDYRWGPGNFALYRRHADELIALGPDVIIGSGLAVRALQQATDTIPIVFTTTIDPISLGYVENLARPRGNTTGFVNINYSFSEKYLELLKQIAPNITRAAVILDSDGAVGPAQLAAIQAKAPSLGIEVTPISVNDPVAMDRHLTAFAREPNGGIITTASTATTTHRDRIIGLAAKHRLPAVYPNRLYVRRGGLVSYGPLFVDQYRRAADYVHRILNGAKPGDLPVQQPSLYETVLNLRTAKALGLSVPRLLIARADEVID
jgi:putative ABC transport system substrate-binding protein